MRGIYDINRYIRYRSFTGFRQYARGRSPECFRERPPDSSGLIDRSLDPARDYMRSIAREYKEGIEEEREGGWYLEEKGPYDNNKFLADEDDIVIKKTPLLKGHPIEELEEEKINYSEVIGMAVVEQALADEFPGFEERQKQKELIGTNSIEETIEGQQIMAPSNPDIDNQIEGDNSGTEQMIGHNQPFPGEANMNNREHMAISETDENIYPETTESLDNIVGKCSQGSDAAITNDPDMNVTELQRPFPNEEKKEPYIMPGVFDNQFFNF